MHACILVHALVHTETQIRNHVKEGAREVTQWLKALVLIQDLGLVLQHPHNGSKLPITPIPVGLIPSGL